MIKCAALSVSLLGALTTSALAVDCKSVLVSSSVSYQHSDTVRLATLDLIDRSNFEENKKSFSGGLDIIVEAVPLSGYANYDEFSQARSRDFQKHSFSFERSESTNLVAQFVPDAAFKAFSDCVRDQSRQSFGLHLIPIQIEDAFVELDVLWNSPPPVRDTPITSNIIGGSFDTPPPLVMPPSTFQALAIKRDPSKWLRVTVSAAGYQAQRFSVPPAPAINPKQPWELSGYKPPMDILVHVQNIGDLNGRDSTWVGTKGNSLRLEGFSISPKGTTPGLEIEYMCHLQDIGDTNWKKAPDFCGTRGQGRRLEGFAIRVVGPSASAYDVSYQCHIENEGDSQTYSNGQYCGTRGRSMRAEAMLITLTKK